MLRELDFNSEEEINKISNFIKKNNEYDYMQDFKWNIIRNEKNKYFLYFEEDNNVLWTCSLFEKNRNNKTVLYSPRGPLLDYSSKNQIEHFFSELEKWMKEKKYNYFVLNPYITKEQLELFPKDYKYEISDGHDYANIFESCKLAIMPIDSDEEKLLDMLPSKLRQNTRRSYRKGLTFISEKEIDLDSFYKLYLETSIRHDFKPHSIDYFRKIIEVYKDQIVYLEVWKDDNPLAMSIDIINNNKLIYLYGVSSSENRNLLGMYNMQWEAIKYCIKNKLKYYDLGGVFCDEDEIDNKDFGLYNFKKGYCYLGFKDILPDINIKMGDDSND